MDHSLGDSDADQLQADTTKSGIGIQEDVDKGEFEMKKDAEVNHSPNSSLYLYDYNPYDLSKRQALNSPADPTSD
jgi:hypothetical protein